MVHSDPVSENSKKADHGLMAFEERPESFDWECFVCDLARAMKRHGFSVGFPGESSSSVVFIYEDVKRLLHGKQDLSKAEWIQHYFGKNIDLDQLKRDCEECLRGEKGVKTFTPRYCSNYLREDDIKTPENEGALSRALMEELPKVVPEQEQSASTRSELGSYVWLKRENGDWLTVFEGKELHWSDDYKALGDIQKLLQRPKEEFDAYSLSDESQQKTGHGSTAIGALIEEGLSISAGPMSSGGQKVSNSKARQRIKKTILELQEERTTTTDLDRIIEIDEWLRALDKTRKNILDQFPDVAKGIKAIKAGIDRLISKIEPDHPKLAEHLRASINRRNNCLIYEPTRQDIHWELAER